MLHVSILGVVYIFDLVFIVDVNFIYEIFFRQRSSSVKGHLPSKVVFRQRSSFVKARLLSKVVFRVFAASGNYFMSTRVCNYFVHRMHRGREGILWLFNIDIGSILVSHIEFFVQ